MPERCEDRDTCCFIQRELMTMSIMVHGILHRFCDNDRDRCARYMVKKMIMNGYTLPDDRALDRVGMMLTDLHPSDTDRAREMIGIMIR